MGGCRAPGNRRDARCACMVISLKKDVARSTERWTGTTLKSLGPPKGVGQVSRYENGDTTAQNIIECHLPPIVRVKVQAHA